MWVKGRRGRNVPRERSAYLVLADILAQGNNKREPDEGESVKWTKSTILNAIDLRLPPKLGCTRGRTSPVLRFQEALMSRM